MRLAVLYVALVSAASGADWGAAVNGLRVSLSVEADTVVISFENVRENREMFLPLGKAVGIGCAEYVYLYLIPAKGARRPLQYTGGSGLAPGRLLPFVVPMMPGSVYSVRTPMKYWRLGSKLEPVESELARGGSLQAAIFVRESIGSELVMCYGLQIFWSGGAYSNVVRR